MPASDGSGVVSAEPEQLVGLGPVEVLHRGRDVAEVGPPHLGMARGGDHAVDGRGDARIDGLSRRGRAGDGGGQEKKAVPSWARSYAIPEGGLLRPGRIYFSHALRGEHVRERSGDRLGRAQHLEAEGRHEDLVPGAALAEPGVVAGETGVGPEGDGEVVGVGSGVVQDHEMKGRSRPRRRRDGAHKGRDRKIGPSPPDEPAARAVRIVSSVVLLGSFPRTSPGPTSPETRKPLDLSKGHSVRVLWARCGYEPSPPGRPVAPQHMRQPPGNTRTFMTLR